MGFGTGSGQGAGDGTLRSGFHYDYPPSQIPTRPRDVPPERATSTLSMPQLPVSSFHMPDTLPPRSMGTAAPTSFHSHDSPSSGLVNPSNPSVATHTQPSPVATGARSSFWTTAGAGIQSAAATFLQGVQGQVLAGIQGAVSAVQGTVTAEDLLGGGSRGNIQECSALEATLQRLTAQVMSGDRSRLDLTVYHAAFNCGKAVFSDEATAVYFAIHQVVAWIEKGGFHALFPSAIWREWGNTSRPQDVADMMLQCLSNMPTGTQPFLPSSSAPLPGAVPGTSVPMAAATMQPASFPPPMAQPTQPAQVGALTAPLANLAISSQVSQLQEQMQQRLQAQEVLQQQELAKLRAEHAQNLQDMMTSMQATMQQQLQTMQSTLLASFASPQAPANPLPTVQPPTPAAPFQGGIQPQQGTLYLSQPVQPRPPTFQRPDVAPQPPTPSASSFLGGDVGNGFQRDDKEGARRMEKAVGKVPRFSGTDNIRGYFDQFEVWARALGLNDVEKMAALTQAVAGEARDFLHNIEGLQAMSYVDLKAVFMANYGQQSAQFLSRLKRLRRGTRSMAEYIKEFRTLRSQAAIAGIREDIQLGFFVDGIEPYELKRAVMTSRPKTVQEAFTIATDLDPLYPRFAHGNNTHRQRGQEENRLQCGKCNAWYPRGVTHTCATVSGAPRRPAPPTYRNTPRVKETCVPEDESGDIPEAQEIYEGGSEASSAADLGDF